MTLEGIGFRKSPKHVFVEYYFLFTALAVSIYIFSLALLILIKLVGILFILLNILKFKKMLPEY